MPEKTVFGIFLGFFLGRIFFSRPLFFSRAVCSFLGHIFVFFLGMIVFLSRAENKKFQGIFLNLTGGNLIFLSGIFFFSG